MAATTCISDLREADDVDENEEARGKAQFLSAYACDDPIKGTSVFSMYDNTYRSSGSSFLAVLLETLARDEKFIPDLRIRACISLASFEELLEDVRDDDPHRAMKLRANEDLQRRNESRVTRALNILNDALTDLFDDWLRLSSLVKYDAVCMLAREGRDVRRFLERFATTSRLEASYRYKLMRALEKDVNRKTCVQGLLEVLATPAMSTTYRILASQNILCFAACEPDLEIACDVVTAQLQIFAKDDGLDMNIRADAADTLIGLGDADDASVGAAVLKELGADVEKARTIYSNAQNVHARSLEKSVVANIEKLIDWSSTAEIMSFEECVSVVLEENDKLQPAIDRIEFDTRKYGGISLSRLLQITTSWMTSRGKDRATLIARLSQELFDSIDTCSSGIAARIVNSLSGFDDYSLTISTREQIISSFTGRVNAILRDGNHRFYTLAQVDILNVFDSDNDDNDDDDDDNDDNDNDDDDDDDDDQDKDSAVKDAIDDFREKILYELDASASRRDRPRFKVLLRHGFPLVEEELRQDFKEVSRDDFDVFYRDAISFYTGL